MTRTYSREDWEAAQAAWIDGEFSDEWKAIRHVMAMQGCIFPPAGDAFDSWEDAQPSQRAVLIRALRETPELLRRCTRKATTWSQVIDRLFAARDIWREELDPESAPDTDRELIRDPMGTIAGIFEKVASSLGYVRADEQDRLERRALEEGKA